MSQFEEEKRQWSLVGIAPQGRDTFGRMVTASPNTMQAYDSIYGVENIYDPTVAGAGSITYLPNISSYQLQVGTTSGDRAINRSKYYHRYQPGKSQEIIMSGVLGPQKTGVISRIGYYDDNDGFFFAMTSTGPVIVIRSSITGSMQETVIPQSQWNIDKGDGTGSSGVTIDFSKTQIYSFNIQWLGSGTQRFSVYVDNKIIILHLFSTFNSYTSPYIKTATLPVSWEIQNLSTTTSSSTMIQTCASVCTVGGIEERGKRFAYSTNPASSIAIGSANVYVLSIKQSSTLNSQTFRGQTFLETVEIVNTSAQAFQINLYRNTTLTGANFQPSGSTASSVTIDRSASAISGGTLSYSWFISGTQRVSQTIDTTDLILRNSNDILTIVATNIGAASSAVFAINWREVY